MVNVLPVLCIVCDFMLYLRDGNSLRPHDAYIYIYIYIHIYIHASVNEPSLVQMMVCRLIGAKQLSELMLIYC